MTITESSIALPSLIRKSFVLIRHGETPLNAAGLIGGITDVPLTERGRAQALAQAESLVPYQFDAVLVSPLRRAQETARLLFPKRPMRIVAGLAERNWGVLEERPQSMQPPYEETPEGGEAWIDFCTRVIEALNTILAQYESPVIVAHSGVFRVIWQLAKGSPYGDRVGNVAPYWICAGDKKQGWVIRPLAEL